MTEFDQEHADRLMDEAFQALEDGEPNVALKIAKNLNSMRYSGSFEVSALAYADLGKTAKAIKTLRDGTDKCPDVWQLWQLLGNYLSDESRFKEAFDAYDNGLAIDGSYLESLKLNYAIALLRSGATTQAKELINTILIAPNFSGLDGSLRARILVVELEVLRTFGKCEDAVAKFEVIGSEDFGDDAGAELSMLWTEYARSLFELGRRDEAENAALRSAWFDIQNEEALSILRETRKKPEDKETNHYNLLVGGDYFPSSEERDEMTNGFFATFHVCADDENEALRFVAELQSDDITNLRIEEVNFVDKVREPKGVYSATAYMLYDEEEDGSP